MYYTKPHAVHKIYIEHYYSFRIAANGLSLVARCAGKKPATIPTMVENMIAATTNHSGIADIFTSDP